MGRKIRMMGFLFLLSSFVVVAEDWAVAAADRSTNSLGSLDSVDELAAAFNEANGVPRLVLLLSPT